MDNDKVHKIADDLKAFAEKYSTDADLADFFLATAVVGIGGIVFLHEETGIPLVLKILEMSIEKGKVNESKE